MITQSLASGGTDVSIEDQQMIRNGIIATVTMPAGDGDIVIRLNAREFPHHELADVTINFS